MSWRKPVAPAAHYLLYGPRRPGTDNDPRLTVTCSCGYALGTVPEGIDPASAMVMERKAVQLLAAHHRDVDLGASCGYLGCSLPVDDDSRLGLCHAHDRAAIAKLGVGR